MSNIEGKPVSIPASRPAQVQPGVVSTTSAGLVAPRPAQVQSGVPSTTLAGLADVVLPTQGQSVVASTTSAGLMDVGQAPVDPGSSYYLHIYLNKIKTFLDTRMGSPPAPSLQELAGASRTHGGFARGRAHGNHPNHADMVQGEEEPIALPSKIHLYVPTSHDERDWTLDNVCMSRTVIKCRYTESLREVLVTMAEKRSPVRSKFLSLFNILKDLQTNQFDLEHNYIIYTYDGHDWILRGRFEVAKADDEEVIWELVENQMITRVLVVKPFNASF